MKVKTLVEHVLEYQRPVGETLEVDEAVGNHLIEHGYAEEVKETRSNAKKSTDPKKEDK
ncbi:hypothetical protein [Bacillus cereus group sp. IBL03679]|uniref:hypothetical protein n=1 Tax=Bacillus cereus group sp. IBL03679 TaxID=3240095 RepID=UPI003D2F5660